MTRTGPTNESENADVRRRAWMRAAQDGDGQAYADLFRDCMPLLRAVTRRQGVPADRVDDVVQDVMLTIHRVRHTYDPGRPFTPWLRAITQRRAIDALRRSGREAARELHSPIAYQAHPDQQPPPDDRIAQSSRAARLTAAIARLPPGQRQAVEQLGLQERSLAEVAAITGRSTGALKVNLHRALNALRVIMGRDR